MTLLTLPGVNFDMIYRMIYVSNTILDAGVTAANKTNEIPSLINSLFVTIWPLS